MSMGWGGGGGGMAGSLLAHCKCPIVMMYFLIFVLAFVKCMSCMPFFLNQIHRLLYVQHDFAKLINFYSKPMGCTWLTMGPFFWILFGTPLQKVKKKS